MNLKQQIAYKLLRNQIIGEKKILNSKVIEVENFLETEREVEKVLTRIAQLSLNQTAFVIKEGLEAIYKDQQIDFERKTGDKTPALGGFPLAKAHGKGMLKVVAILMRFTAIKKELGGSLSTLILDEAFLGLDAKALPIVLQFVKKIGRRFGINVLSITNITTEAESADILYRFKKVGSKTKAVKIDNLL